MSVVSPKRKRKKPVRPKRKAAAIQADRNRIAALDMKSMCMTYKEIGLKLGVSYQRAEQYVTQALEELRQERLRLAAKYVDLQLRKLNRVARSLIPKALGDERDLASVDRLLRVYDQEARLVIPLKVAPVSPDGNMPYVELSDDELRTRLLALGYSNGSNGKASAGPLALDGRGVSN